ncbi:MAG: class I SAM-dependent methyltransferase [Alphaproteobacteria bacterium]|nr:class I SAM-dependent methyltransferase [Alphaproteobacteria bacterium]
MHYQKCQEANVTFAPISFKSRNEINENRLNWLEKYSKKLPVPNSFGNFISEQHHLDTLELFIQSTLETRHRGLFFLQKIIPQLTNKSAFLDIGPGKGKLTKWIGRKFKAITVVDPCSLALDNIRLQHFKTGTSLAKIQDNFMNTEFNTQSFDLINMSHVIYYIEKDHLIENMKRAYDLLRPNGVLVIVFNEGLHREQLAQDFGARPNSFELFLREFSIFYDVNIHLYLSKESFLVSNLASMLHICGLHLHDYGQKVDNNSLKAYIKHHYLLPEGKYSMSMYQKFAIIRKN